jgi:hypothetical protein
MTGDARGDYIIEGVGPKNSVRIELLDLDAVNIRVVPGGR